MTKGDCASRCEELVDDALRVVLRRKVYYCRNLYPKWLKNPETGRSLQLDFWIPKLKIAFEVQGPHHFEDPKQARLDTLKVDLCSKRGIRLVPLLLSELKVAGLQKILWDHTKSIGKQPFKFLHSERQLREGTARQHHAVDIHTSVLVSKHGYSAALPAPSVSVKETKLTAFIKELLKYSHIQWEEKKGKLGPPRRILNVDPVEGIVLVQVGNWRHRMSIKKLRKRRPVFPTAA